MERLEAGVVTREFQTVISVFSLRRIEDEERGYRKGGGRARGSSPCRVTRVQRVTNVSDSKLVRSGSFSLAFVVPCKSLVSRNTWNSCVGLRTLSRKPCNHLLLFILQLSPPSIEFLFFPLENLYGMCFLYFPLFGKRKIRWIPTMLLFLLLVKDVV